MSAFGNGSTNLGQPDPTPKASWRYVMRRAAQQSGWNRIWRETDDLGDARHAEHSRKAAGGWKSWAILVAAVVLLAIPISYGVIQYLDAPGALRRVTKGTPAGKSLLGFTQAAKPKPSPDTPLVPAAQQQHFTNPTTWTPGPPPQSPWVAETPQQPAVMPPSLPGQVQPQTSNLPPSAPPPVASIAPTARPQPVVPGKPAFAPLSYPAKHDKLFGDSCVGQLTLNATGLSFSCPGNPGAAVQIPLNQIGAVDENGILLVSGKKYHFSIRGMSKDAEQQLFSNWLHRAR
jgi:hypothetical protein